MNIVTYNTNFMRFYRAEVRMPEYLSGYMPYTFRKQPGKYTEYRIENHIVKNMFETLVLHSMYMWDLNETN